MERVINRRRVWYLESHNLLTNVQCGFRSRVDHLVKFERFCREAFIHNQHLVLVFFDLEKAYDTTWKYGIMKDLHGFGLRGHLPIFIAICLKDRSFKVLVGSSFSDSHPQEMGVPLGSILSVTLFSVKINSITQCLKPGVDCSLYVDDFQICDRSSNMSIIERQLQLCLNKLQQWATDNGFRFSKTKTLCMHICQKRGLHLDPQLFLDKNPIPVVEETKFLEVIFESLYVDAHEPSLGMLQYATKIKSLPNHPAHNAVFDNTYMKLFDARPSAIPTFGLRIKQFVTASNIEFSDILETPSYFILPPWCIKPPKIVLDLVHLKKRSNRCINIPATFLGNSRQVP